LQNCRKKKHFDKYKSHYLLKSSCKTYFIDVYLSIYQRLKSWSFFRGCQNVKELWGFCHCPRHATILWLIIYLFFQLICIYLIFIKQLFIKLLQPKNSVSTCLSNRCNRKIAYQLIYQTVAIEKQRINLFIKPLQSKNSVSTCLSNRCNRKTAYPLAYQTFAIEKQRIRLFIKPMQTKTV